MKHKEEDCHWAVSSFAFKDCLCLWVLGEADSQMLEKRRFDGSEVTLSSPEWRNSSLCLLMGLPGHCLQGIEVTLEKVGTGRQGLYKIFVFLYLGGGGGGGEAEEGETFSPPLLFYLTILGLSSHCL